MRLSRFLCAGVAVLSTSSCSSLYDVWQGYDDIEPEVPSAQDFQTPRQGRGELDEVVVRAKTENNFMNTPAVREDITVKQIEEIYAKAKLQSEADLEYDMEIPERPPVSIEQDLQSNASMLPEAETTEVSEVIETIEAVEETTEGAVSSEVINEDGTIVIGGEEPEISEETVEPASTLYQDELMETNFEEVDGTVIIGGDASIPMTPNETEQTMPVAEIPSAPVVAAVPVPTPVARAPLPAPKTKSDPYQPLISGDDYSSSIDAFDTVMIGEEGVSSVSSENAIGATVLASTIKYNKGSDKLSTKDVKDLKAVAAEYRKNPAMVKVMGFAVNYDDNLGVDKAMELMDLATRRSEKVAAQLRKFGIKDADIDVSADALDASSGNTVTKKNVTEIYFEF